MGYDGAVSKKWIAGAVKHKGALHRALHVPEGETGEQHDFGPEGREVLPQP